MHIVHTLYHIKRQYANIRPRGRDEKLKKIRFYLTFHINIRTKFTFFNQKSKKVGHPVRAHTQMTKEKISCLKHLCIIFCQGAPSKIYISYPNRTPRATGTFSHQKYRCNWPPFCFNQRFARSTPGPYSSRTVAQNSSE